MGGDSHLPSSLDRDYDYCSGSLAHATMTKSARQRKGVYGKRPRTKTSIRFHQGGDSLGTLCGKYNGSLFETTSRGAIGSVCSSISSPSATASLRPLDNSPATPAKKRYHNSWPAAQEKELPSSSTLIYRPKIFQNCQVYTEDEENAPPNTDDFYRTNTRSDSICCTRSSATGLCNLGNTCFMNAAIQCLAHTPSLADFFLSKDYKIFVSKEKRLGHCVADVIDNIYRSNSKYSYCSQRKQPPYSPDDFLDEFASDDVAPQFAGSRQHDSHEFLRVLIDRLCDDLKDRARCQENQIREATQVELEEMPLQSKADYWWRQHLAQNSSFVTDEFCGQLISTIQCTVCKKNSYCFDPFYDISLPFPEGGQRRRSSMLSILSSTDLSTCSLDDCLREFCKDEILDGENMPECSKCRERRESIKRLQVFKFPRVLVLHLKRFGNSRKKVCTSIDFPMASFDASPIAYADRSQTNNSDNPTYDLYAVCNHSGRLNYGHYTSTCIDPHSGSWYKFNDERVSQQNDSPKLDEAGAYILFYRLQECES